ncbi:EamA family transporter [Clostridium beijerinckii]|uniref:EamA family transporter n=1 Tax=Clostridium beijerinckii TaxID=1520 RepID=UPI00232EAC5A|nr:EamA family transporter [Clostridium beijerinckii]
MNKKYFSIVFLQAIIVIYTLSGICAKFASGHNLLSVEFIGFYGLEIIVLGVYAILWQQVLKRFDVSVAYANRSIALIWSLIWSVVFFGERITIQNIIGTIIVILGIVVVNLDE